MLADSIAKYLVNASLISPVILLIIIIIAFFILKKNERKIASMAIIIAIAVALIGSLIIEPIESGGWNWQFIFYPFLFCKWALIGFVFAWPTLLIINGISLKLYIAPTVISVLVGITYLILTVSYLTYSKSAYIDDRAFWNNVFDRNLINYSISEYTNHLSRGGKEVVYNKLHYNQDNISSDLLIILSKVGFYIADQKNNNKQTIEDLFKVALKNLKEHHPESPAGYGVAADLARNPATPVDILQKLKDTESTVVKKSLASNPDIPESLLKSLISDAQKKIDEEMKKPNNQRFYANYSEIIDRANKNLDSRKK